jgi:MoaA/NifB/PqqE/SkfB family radical SAM enzyme
VDCHAREGGGAPVTARPVGPLTALVRTLAAAPAVLRVPPRLSAFLARYLSTFPLVDVGGRLVLHSHLPALDSPAYARFVRLHLLDRIEGPSHAQVAVTHACPQRCPVCYNRDRGGDPLHVDEIRRVIEDLIGAGVTWLGLTGGEPLLRRELTALVALGRGRAEMKLFTTGMGATRQRAEELADAGLGSVSVSLDHCDEAANDAGRGYPGAWRAAVSAIDAFLATGRLHVGISAVLPRDALQGSGAIGRLLELAGRLGVHELWLSEAKPAVPSLWDPALVLPEEERLAVAAFQDRWNARVRREKRGVTLNYLGHFEGAGQFGCNAGRKMVYVDPFGDVGPCVFLPCSAGNVRERPLGEILGDMWRRFPSGDRCFANQNWAVLRDCSGGVLPMPPARTAAMLDRIERRPLSAFNDRYYGARSV